MPQTDTQPTAKSATPARTEPAAPPRLGESVTVVVADGVSLRNNEIGVPFVPGVPTLQTVTVTLLRRLADGDLRLV